MSRRPRTPSRALTTFAVGFLLLDGVLLTYSGLALHRTMLVVWGVACVIAAGLVVLGWRRYRRAMAELEQARRELRAEAESIRDLLHRKHLHN
jgi:beta-lactamase regulating signal transducer with metallopeptidase domain